MVLGKGPEKGRYVVGNGSRIQPECSYPPLPESHQAKGGLVSIRVRTRDIESS